MNRVLLTPGRILCLATVVTLVAVQSAVQPAARSRLSTPGVAETWTVSRTVDGQPDLQGVWDTRSATPLERPDEYAGREFLTEQEAADFEQRAAARGDGRPPGDPRTTPSVHPVWWLDYGRKVVGTRRTSLIVEPADGRIPPLTAEAQQRAADRRAVAGRRGPADSWEDRSLWERCITRGLPESMLPGPYNSNLQILQTADHVVLLTEMIHDARIVPLDGRPYPRGITQWMGVSRGRWEDTTLIVETANFSEKSNYRGATAGLHLVERFRRVDAGTLEYRVTVTDPTTWKSPWTMTLPMVKSEGLVYEYACHEGNYGLRNMLTVARAADGAGSEAAPKND